MFIHKQNNPILYYNGKIYGSPFASAILCKDGKISSIGKREDFNIQNIVDLQGGFVYPGFIDSHLHLLGVGQAIENVNLIGLKSPYEAIKILEGFDCQDKNIAWILGRGWDQTLWDNQTFPNKNILDKGTNCPVALRRVDGHALWVNSRAMEIAGVTPDTQSPHGGIIIKNKKGEPTGVFIDNAMNLILDVIPKPGSRVIKRQLQKAITHLNLLGLTSVHDPGTDPDTISILKKNSFNSTLGVYAMLNYKEKEMAPFLSEGPLINDSLLTVRAIKIYLDGALGSRGAALLEAYSDDSKNHGLIIENVEKVQKDIRRFNKLGFQTAIHCIGDRANRIALDIYEKVGVKLCRNRIEHAQIIHENDISRFAELGVLPCMQTVHCTSDMNWIQSRLGKNKLSEAYPWNSLIQSGTIIPGGSDAPIESANPLRGIYAAITRKDEEGNPPGGWQKQETISRNNAIKMYTEWAAYAAFEEKSKGKIQEGFNGDFTVLSKDLLTVHPTEILDNKIKMTIVNGKVVYSA